MTHLEVISLFRAKRVSQNQYEAICPAHNDKNPSLGINTAEDGKTLIHCRAGCSTEAVCAAVGIEMKDLFDGEAPKQGTPAPASKKTATPQKETAYNYTDFTGRVQLRKVRKYDANGKKYFPWYHLEGDDWKSGRAGAVPGLYNQGAILDTESLFIAEGEKDAETLKGHGIIAVSGADGAGPGKWRPEHTELLRGKHVAIIPDNDSVGKAFAQETAAALYGVAASVRVLDLTKIWPDLPEHGDVTDLYEVMGIETGDVLTAKVISTPEWTQEQAAEPPATADPAKLIFYDTVEYEDPEFLVAPYIPLGKITIIQADSGVGKTALACKLAACVSRGLPMQDEPCQAGKVLILSVEDDPATLRGRIEASGGDLTKCAFLENAYELSFTSPEIEQVVQENGVKLVVFDPLQAFLGAGMDMHRANETRPIMAHLAAMAKRTGCAVIIISHMSKGTAGGKAIYRALGSVDIPAASRSVLYIERNPQNEDQCVIVHIKSSNAKAGRAVLYRIGDRGGVQWEGYSSMTIDDLIMQAERREKGIEYEDDPLVQVIEMFHQDNPQGAFISWEQLDNYANRILGFFPCENGKDWNAKLKKMQREFTERSKILFDFKNTYMEEHIEFGEKVIPEEKRKVRGVRIMPHKPRMEFQIGWDEKDE